MKILSITLLFFIVSCSYFNNDTNKLAIVKSLKNENYIMPETATDTYNKALLEQVLDPNKEKVLKDGELTLSEVVRFINKRYSKNFSEEQILVIYKMAKEKNIDLIYIIKNCFITENGKINL